MNSKCKAFALIFLAAALSLGVIAGCSSSKPANSNSENVATAFSANDAKAPTPKGDCTPRSAEERMATSTSDNTTPPGRHVVYLTIDDGPSGNTPAILEILDRYGVKATWFVKGIQPEIAYVKDIWDAGHQLAIHTYTHDYPQVYASVDSYWNDVEKTGELIKQYVGFSPTLLRFPGGSINDYNKAVRGQIFAEMNQRGYHYFDWNVSCGDGADHSAGELIGYTKDEADGCKSVCMLLHDSDSKGTTVEALPQFIEYFIEEGYTFDVLTADTFGYHF